MTWENLTTKMDKWSGMLAEWKQTPMNQSARDERLFGKMNFLWVEPLEKLQEMLCLSPVNGETDLRWESPEQDGSADAGYMYCDITDGQVFRKLNRSIEDDSPGAHALGYILYSDETLLDNGGVRTIQHVSQSFSHLI